MKDKISVSLSADLVKRIDKRAKQTKRNRSDFLKAAAWEHINRLVREEQNAKDLAIINRRAEFLNKEAADVLAYQKPL